MRRFRLLTKVSLFFFILLISPNLQAQPAGKGFVEATEEDLSPSCFGYQLKFSNSTVTDNGDGTCSVTSGGGGGSESTTVSDTTTIDLVLTGADITANGLYTAGDALTLTGADIDFDGGTTPSGDLGGTWASPSVTDDSHAHTSTTISGIDISADTNLTAGTNITLTGDDLSVDDSFLLNTGDTGSGGYVFTDNIGIGTTLTSATTGLAVVGKNVGIGTWSPTAAFAIGTAFTITTAGLINGRGTITNTNFVHSNNNSCLTLGGINVCEKNAGDIQLIPASGRNVGIGTASPTSLFEIGVEKFNVLSGGNIGIGTKTPVAGLSVMNGNVGVGTWSPTSKLQVVGTVGATNFSGAGTSLTGTAAYLTSGNVITNANLSGDVTSVGNTATIADSVTVTGWALGTSSVTDDAYAVGWNGSSNIPTKNALYDKIETIGASGGGWTDGGTAIYQTDTTDRVGIGTTSPQHLLQVNGAIGFQSLVGIGTTQTTLSFVEATANGSNVISFTAPSAITSDVNCVLENDSTPIPDSCVGDGTDGGSGGGWEDGGTNIYNTATTDNVGIGTTTPSTTLEIVKQSSQDLLMVSATATGDGNYLIVKSDGNVGIGTVSPVGGLIVMNGNVGIGTFSPINILQVSGKYRELNLLPQGAVLDDNSPPALTVVESTGTGTSRRYVADFDPSTDEIIYWSFVVPTDMITGSWIADVFWFTNDTTASETAYWETQLSCTSEGDADSMAEDIGATVNTGNEDINTTEANRLISTTITMSNTDSVASNDFCTLRFARDANNASDDLTSDARLLEVRLKIPTAY